MEKRLLDHAYILGTVCCTVYGLVVIKWQMISAGRLPEGIGEKFFFLLKMMLNPWVMSGYVSAFCASLFWMAAMTKLDLSYAYPFTSLSFILVAVFSWLFFQEPITAPKIIGILLVISGIIITAKG